MTRNLAIANSAQTVTTAIFKGGGVCNARENMWYISVGSHSQKHKCQHWKVFHWDETFVTPSVVVVVAALTENCNIPQLYSTSP